MSNDLVIASTTDTPEQMAAALEHGLEETTPDDALSTETVDEKPAGEKPAGEEAEPAAKADDAAAEGDADKKAAEPKADDEKPKVEAKADPKADDKKRPARPKRDDFKSEDEWADALIGWGATKRIDKVTAEKHTERERREAVEVENERLKRENDELRAGKPAEEKPAAERVSDKPEPKAEDFDTHEEWLKALSKHHAAVAVEAQADKDQREAAEAAEATAMRQRNEAYQERLQVAEQRYPDFAETLKAADLRGTRLSAVMQHVVMTSEVGPDILHYLAQPEHDEEAKRLFALDGPDGIRAMGRVEERVHRVVTDMRQQAIDEAEQDGVAEQEAPKPKQKAPLTKAAEPIDPIRGTRTVNHETPLDDVVDQSEYNRRRDEMDRRRRGRR